MKRHGAAGLVGLFLMLASVWVLPTKAYACDCPQVTDAEYVAQADAIFTGRIIENETSPSERIITFAVERIYKGDVSARQVVRTERAGCGLRVNGPDTYVVFAAVDPDPQRGLTANQCGGTRTGPAPIELGEGWPAPDEPTPAGPAEPAGLRLFLIGAFAILVGVMIAVRQRRSGRAEG